MKTIIGVFERYSDALDVVEMLIGHGYVRDDISMVTNDHDADAMDEPRKGRAWDSVASGMGIGGMAGLLLGLAAMAIPGIGPVLAAGPLVAALGGAGLGVAAGGLVGVLVRTGVPHQHAHHLAEQVRQGATLVSVVVSDGDDAHRAAAIMLHGRPAELAERGGAVRPDTWTDQSAPRQGPGRAVGIYDAAPTSPPQWRDDTLPSPTRSRGDAARGATDEPPGDESGERSREPFASTTLEPFRVR